MSKNKPDARKTTLQRVGDIEARLGQLGVELDSSFLKIEERLTNQAHFNAKILETLDELRKLQKDFYLIATTRRITWLDRLKHLILRHSSRLPSTATER